MVVTGMGAVTPVGLDVESAWGSLLRGQSGVASIETFDTSDLDVKIAAQVKDFNAFDYLDRKKARALDPFLQFGLVAAKEAVRDAALQVCPAVADRAGVIAGSGIGGLQTMVQQISTLVQRGPDRVSPLAIPMFLPDMLSGLISMEIGAKGPNFAASSACATSAHCVGEAAEMIRRGDADIMLAGGAEAGVTRIGVAAFDALRALSRRNHAPQAASRPFDAERDGFVLAEGSAMLVLERLEHALDRGARIYAELAGYGATGDAYHMTAPCADGEGAERAMRIALRKAGLEPSDIGYINAHGTSTAQNDRTETRAIKTVFGHQTAPPVSSTKSMTGHMMGAGGALEAIVCIKVLNGGCLPPTINYENPDPECDLDYVPNIARHACVHAALTNSLGFGGHNVALVFKRFES